ncbi:MAG: acyltransferase family protein [Bacillota bacterium]|nr:acyltransferase family protein [Bacillota bacterium]
MTNNLFNKKVCLDNCTFVKTSLMFFVVLYHSCIFWTGTWSSGQSVAIESNILAIFAEWLNTFHIYGFVLVSGYLFFYHMNETKRYYNYHLFIESKIKRLILPYWFVMLVWVAPIAEIVQGYSYRELIVRYFFGTSPNQLWFLWMLFWVFVIIWPLNNIIKNNFGAFIISVFSWGIGLIGSKVVPNIFCIWSAFNCLPYFIIGMKFREKSEKAFMKIPTWFLLFVDIVIFMLLQRAENCSGLIARVSTLGLSYIVRIVGSVVAFLVLQRVALKMRVGGGKQIIHIYLKIFYVNIFVPPTNYLFCDYMA